MSWNLIISNVLQMDSADLHCVISEQSQNYIGGYYLISTAYRKIRYLYFFEETTSLGQ